jgi:hypothetical protein
LQSNILPTCDYKFIVRHRYAGAKCLIGLSTSWQVSKTTTILIHHTSSAEPWLQRKIVIKLKYYRHFRVHTTETCLQIFYITVIFYKLFQQWSTGELTVIRTTGVT